MVAMIHLLGEKIAFLKEMESEKPRAARSCHLLDSPPAKKFSSHSSTFSDLGKARWTGPSLTLATPTLVPCRCLLRLVGGLAELDSQKKPR